MVCCTFEGAARGPADRFPRLAISPGGNAGRTSTSCCTILCYYYTRFLPRFISYTTHYYYYPYGSEVRKNREFYSYFFVFFCCFLAHNITLSTRYCKSTKRPVPQAARYVIFLRCIGKTRRQGWPPSFLTRTMRVTVLQYATGGEISRKAK